MCNDKYIQMCSSAVRGRGHRVQPEAVAAKALPRVWARQQRVRLFRFAAAAAWDSADKVEEFRGSELRELKGKEFRRSWGGRGFVVLLFCCVLCLCLYVCLCLSLCLCL